MYRIHQDFYSALVAQMVERKTLNLVVVGSIPTEGVLLPAVTKPLWPNG